MQQDIKMLSVAIGALLDSLDDTRKSELRELIPDPREGNARKWVEEVIRMFGLDQPECELCHDIERQFPDESVFKGAVFDNANGIFEAEILLREAKEVLLTKK